MSFEFTDLITVGLLVLLEAILSADNALVLAVLVLPLPVEQQKKALRYGILGAFAFRIVATLFAVYLMSWEWVKLLGGLYLLYLPIKHFWTHPDLPQAKRPHAAAGRILGLSIFWSVVVRVELTDIVFAIDSILVAVAMSPKVWVVISGGILGILTIRMVVGQLLSLVREYPAIVDGAYVIVAWVGVKLVIHYAHSQHWLPFEIPTWLSIGVSIVLFIASAFYARMRHGQSAVPPAGEAEGLPNGTKPPAVTKS